MIDGDDGSTLIRDLMFALSGLPEVIARMALNHALCELSEACVFQPEIAVPTQNCVAQVKFDDFVPTGWEMLGIEIVKYCGTCLDPVDKCSRCPNGYRVDDLCMITLYPAPSQDAKDDLILCINVQPSEDICEYPATVIKKHKRMLLDGAKAFLMSMPDKAWSNTGLAAFHGRKFEAACASAQLAEVKQHTHRTQVATGECW